jgi:hypothetical protein
MLNLNTPKPVGTGNRKYNQTSQNYPEKSKKSFRRGEKRFSGQNFG